MSRSRSPRRERFLVERDRRSDDRSAETVSTPRAGTSAVPPASPWFWMGMALLLLAASGGVRVWQDSRFGSASTKASSPPFPLRTLPNRLGAWRAVEGTERALDPKVARIAGCSDHLIRTYVHEVTGVEVTAMVLYGNAEAVTGHTPEVCYPSAGYRLVEVPTPRVLSLGEMSAAFRSCLFAREEGRSGPGEEVFYSFRHERQWFTDVETHWKGFRHAPSLFKVQTQRRVSAGEHRDLDNPTEAFLSALLPALERRLVTELPRRVAPAPTHPGA